MKRGFGLFLVLFIVTLAIDQAVKIWAERAMPPHGSLSGLPWPGVFEFTLTFNKGIAFGMFQGLGVFLAPVAIAIAVGAAIYSLRHPQESAWSHSAMGLLASGAIGNLYDRLALGHVRDMFWFRLIDFPVFNVADACITVATAMLMIVWWRAPHSAPGNAAAAKPPTVDREGATD